MKTGHPNICAWWIQRNFFTSSHWLGRVTKDTQQTWPRWSSLTVPNICKKTHILRTEMKEMKRIGRRWSPITKSSSKRKKSHKFKCGRWVELLVLLFHSLTNINIIILFRITLSICPFTSSVAENRRVARSAQDLSCFQLHHSKLFFTSDVSVLGMFFRMKTGCWRGSQSFEKLSTATPLKLWTKLGCRGFKFPKATEHRVSLQLLILYANHTHQFYTQIVKTSEPLRSFFSFLFFFHYG